MAAARRSNPPLTEENLPSALFRTPPLMHPHSPLATLAEPPKTEELRPAASFLRKKEITGHYDRVLDLLIDIAALVREVGAKLTNLPSASKTWSWAERLGTPKELRNTGKKVEEVQASAEKAKKDLDALTKSINQLGATP